MTFRPARDPGGQPPRPNSEYADVPDMFRELAKLEPDSPEFRRHRDRIVERCLPLADHIARRFDGRGEARDDLVQVARVGLVNAVIRYDVDTGSDFVSFAVPTIMGEVRRHFRDNSWSVKVPRRLKELHLRLGAATSELSQKLGRAPTASELAAELEMDRQEVVEGLVAGSSYNTLSIDSGGGGDEDAPAILDTSVYDEVVTVNAGEAIEAARLVARLEGVPVGISAGAALQAAIEVGQRGENAGKNIVVIIPSFAERYLSTVLFEGLGA